MQIFRSWQSLHAAPQLEGCVATIGNFDGVHLGHQHLIHELKTAAKTRQTTSLVITFHPHPRALLTPDKAPKRLISLHDRLYQLQQTGVDAVLVLPFTHAIAKLSPQAFIESLYASCRMQHMHIGHDFAFGKNRSGHWQELQRIGQHIGFEVSQAKALSSTDTIISSSAIRQAVLQADFDKAQQLLGRRYSICGHVGTGDQRGRDLGFRTTNMALHQRCHPPIGIYAVWAHTTQQHWAGAAYIGSRPTFAGQGLRLETTLLDANINLYRQRLNIEFVQYIRADKKFEDSQALSQQIVHDCQQVRDVLQQNPFQG
ncbi:MAG: bifunctional riboflavin kinase/FAD synthetase [Mariprofundaceae bacterium]|nr:bifunctional riboflavin kinase/FAD synthetase [Mariprofundaceae bacterium]